MRGMAPKCDSQKTHHPSHAPPRRAPHPALRAEEGERKDTGRDVENVLVLAEVCVKLVTAKA